MAWGATSILELTVGYLANLQQCLLVTHWMGGDVGSGFTELEISEKVAVSQQAGGNGTLTGELQKCLSSSAVIDFVRCQVVFPTRLRHTKLGCNIAGLRGAGVGAQNLQASVEKQTQKAGRSQIGGMRIGGIPTGEIVTGILAAGYMTALNAFANWYLNGSGSLSPDVLVTWWPVIANREKIPATDPPKYRIKGGSTVAVVTTFNTVRTMSRRTIGRGE